METRGFAISFATCQPGNTSEYTTVMLVRGPDPSDLRYANPPPLLRQRQLV